MARLAALFAAAVALASAAPTGRLIGAYRSAGDFTKCSLVALDLATGANSTIAQLDICAKVQQTYPAFSTAGFDGTSIVIAISTAPSVSKVDLSTGKTTPLANLPPYNYSDAYLGLVGSAGTYWLVTQSGVWNVSGASASPYITFATPAPSQAGVTIDSRGGTNGMGRIFIADEGSTSITVVDLGAPTVAPDGITSGVDGPMDLQWTAAINGGALLEVAHYALYATSPSSGKSTLVSRLPDGPGYPRVNTMGPAGVFIFVDFANAFWVTLSPASVSAGVPFTAAPRVVGFPIWVPK